MIAKKQKNHKIVIEVDSVMEHVMKDLTAKVGGSEAEVLRRAICLLKVVKDAEVHNQSVAIISEDNKIVTKLVGL